MENVDKYGIPNEYRNLVDKGMSSTFHYWSEEDKIPSNVIELAGVAASEVFFEILDGYLASGEYMNRFIEKHKGVVRAIRNIEKYTEARRVAENRLWELERLLSSHGYDCICLRKEAVK